MLGKYRSIRIALAVLGLALLAACNGDLSISRLLLVDMDAATPATNIAESLPGPPDGDRAENLEDFGIVTIPQLDGDSLRTRGNIDLLPIAHSEATEYTITWNGYWNNIGNSPTIISFLDGDNRIALRLTLHQQAVVNDGPPATNLSGTDPHAVEIVARPSSNRFDYEFTQLDCAAVTDCTDVSNVEFVDPHFGLLTKVRIEGGEYHIDDFSVIVKPGI